MLVDVHAQFDDSTPPGRLHTYAGLCGLDYVLVANGAAASTHGGGTNLDEATANGAALEASRKHRRLLPLYWARPGERDSYVHALAGALASEPFVGLFLSPAENGYDVTDKLLDPYIDVLTTAERPCVIRVSDDSRSRPAQIGVLAKRHPDVAFVLCICAAKPELRAEALDVIRRSWQSQDAQMYLDTSHADGNGVRTAVRALGAERVVYGTDALRHGESHVPRHIALLDELRKSLAAEEFRLVAGANAARLFGLQK